jgi:hypothetical protein
MYVHVNAAHESTGQHAETLDVDLVQFLTDFFAENAGKEVVVFFEGDHGMRYGEWYKSIPAF